MLEEGSFDVWGEDARGGGFRLWAEGFAKGLCMGGIFCVGNIYIIYIICSTPTTAISPSTAAVTATRPATQDAHY